MTRLDWPVVSIGMPVLNEERLVAGAIESLLAQTYPHFELLIGDNASTDTTREICERYAARDPRVQYQYYDERTPPQENFNRLLPRARGKYFIWTACDDQREPQYIEKLVAALEAEPRATVAFCRFTNIDRNGTIVKRYSDDWPATLRLPLWRQFAAFIFWDESNTQKANFIYGLFRTADILAVGGIARHRKAYSGADVLTLLRLLARGPFVFVDETLFHYAVRDVVPRDQQPLGRYLLQRVFGRTSGHAGNLREYLIHNHEFHYYTRRFVAREMPAALPIRVLFWSALWLRELIAPCKRIPLAVAKELGISGPKS